MTLSLPIQQWLMQVLEERFGWRFLIAQKDNLYKLTLPGHSKTIHFPLNDKFYQTNKKLPCIKWNARAEGWDVPIEDELFAPGLSDLLSPLIEFNDNGALVHYDILGLTYWMLNRVEEINRSDVDEHGRFPAIHSHAYKYEYLERPVVDEWFFILGQIMLKTWRVSLKQHSFSMKVSHDVDAPSMYSFKSWKTFIRMMAGDVLKRKDIISAFKKPLIKIKSKKEIIDIDPHNTFDAIMSISENYNLQSAFYFICGRTDKTKDADYEIEHPLIKKLLLEIHKREHEIGLHPSYGSFLKPEIIKKEADRLRSVLQELNIPTAIGGRMHYLRWSHPTTLQAWNDAGMVYDTTLSYADMPGFRCGTCFEYPAFNHLTQKTLNLRIRPLIVMECTVIAERYMNLGYSKEALNKMFELKNKCKKVNGTFTLLWHNSHFTNKEDFEIYEAVIKG